MKKKLSTEKEVNLKEISVDDMNEVKDMLRFGKDENGQQYVYNIHRYNTAWIRKGVEGSDDKFLKSLTESEKVELAELVQEFNRLGE
tara:strand:- start:302 stop:562 length:261 start_codon:yes stop_codon:yes gene_type:complete